MQSYALNIKWHLSRENHNLRMPSKQGHSSDYSFNEQHKCAFMRLFQFFKALSQLKSCYPHLVIGTILICRSSHSFLFGTILVHPRAGKRKRKGKGHLQSKSSVRYITSGNFKCNLLFNSHHYFWYRNRICFISEKLGLNPVSDT